MGNRVGGKAVRHLRPLRVNAVNPYATTEEILNKEANAKREFRKLKMRATDKFQNFLSNFLHLAGYRRGKVPCDDVQGRAIPEGNMEAEGNTVKELMDSSTDFDAYTAVCTKLADHLSSSASPGIRVGREQIRYLYLQDQRREGILTSGTAPTSRITAEELPPEKRELIRRGNCFYCRLPEHIARGCPLHPLSVRLQAELSCRLTMAPLS